MSFRIEYHWLVVEKDIPKLDSSMKDRVKEAILTKLLKKPELFGIHLRNDLKGYRKLRVGDYRVIFAIKDDCVRIFAIQHRSTVYKLLFHRIGL